MSQTTPVIVYGTRWCAATMMARRYLDREGIPYEYRDLEQDEEAAKQVRWWTGGNLSHPTIKVRGDILVEPDSQELKNALGENGYL